MRRENIEKKKLMKKREAGMVSKRDIELIVFVGILMNGFSYTIMVDNWFKVLPPLVFIVACAFFCGAVCFNSLKHILNKTEESFGETRLIISASMLGLSVITMLLTIFALAMDIVRIQMTSTLF